MWEPEYEDMLVQYDAEKLAIPEDRMNQILAQLDELAEAHALKERVAAILERLAKSGRYSHITYDPHAGVYVLIRPDGTRTAHAPDQLDMLFNATPERPQRSTLQSVR